MKRKSMRSGSVHTCSVRIAAEATVSTGLSVAVILGNLVLKGRTDPQFWATKSHNGRTAVKDKVASMLYGLVHVPSRYRQQATPP